MTRKMCYQCSLSSVCVVTGRFETMFMGLQGGAAFCLNCGRFFVTRLSVPESSLSAVRDVWQISGGCHELRDYIYVSYDWLTSCPRCVGALPNQQAEYKAIRNDTAPGQYWRHRELHELQADMSKGDLQLVYYPVLLRWRTSTSGRVRSGVEFEWDGSRYVSTLEKTELSKRQLKGEQDGQL